MLPRVQPFQYPMDGSVFAGHFQDISTRSLQTVAVGASAGAINAGVGNAFIGYEAGYEHQRGAHNTFVGFQAGYQSKNVTEATCIGAFAGKQNTGNDVVFVGYRAGEYNREGMQCVAVGPYAMRENVSGTGSVSVGYGAGERNQDGDYNTAIGTFAAQNNRSGNFNTMCGYQSGRGSFMGNQNTYFGAFSGFSNMYGTGNAFIGYKTGEYVENGSLNVAIGAYALQNTTNATCNIAIGPYAGGYTNDMVNSVAVGLNAGTHANGVNNVYLGNNAGTNILQAINTTAVGTFALKDAMYSRCNVAIGTSAGAHMSNASETVIIGNNAGIFSQGNKNVFIGADVAQLNEYDCNVIIGYGAGQHANTHDSVIIGAGTATNMGADKSIVIGHKSGMRMQTGMCNVLIGIGADSLGTHVENGIAIGTKDAFVTDYSISLGYNLYNRRAFSTIIGYNLDSDANNSIIIGKQINIQSVAYFRDILTSATIDNVQFDARKKFGIDVIQYGDDLNSLYRSYNPYGFASTGITSNTFSSALTYTPQTVRKPYLIQQDAPDRKHTIVHPVTVALDDIRQASYYILRVLSDDVYQVPNQQVTISTQDFFTKHTSNVRLLYKPNYPSMIVTNVLSTNQAYVDVPVYVGKHVKRPAFLNSNYTLLQTPPTVRWDQPYAMQLQALDLQWVGNGFNIYGCNIGSLRYVVTDSPSFGYFTNHKTIYTSNDVLQYIPHAHHAFGMSNDRFSLTPILQITDAENVQYGVSGYPIEIKVTANTYVCYNQTITNPTDSLVLTRQNFALLPNRPASVLTFTVRSPNVTLYANSVAYTSISGSFSITYGSYLNGVVSLSVDGTNNIQNAFDCSFGGIPYTFHVVFNAMPTSQPALVITSFIQPFAQSIVSTSVYSTPLTDVFVATYPITGTLSIAVSPSVLLQYEAHNPFLRQPNNAYASIPFIASSNQGPYTDILWNIYTNDDLFVRASPSIIGFGTLTSSTVSSSNIVSQSTPIQLPIYNYDITITSNLDANTVIHRDTSNLVATYNPQVGYSIITSNIRWNTTTILDNTPSQPSFTYYYRNVNRQIDTGSNETIVNMQLVYQEPNTIGFHRSNVASSNIHIAYTYDFASNVTIEQAVQRHDTFTFYDAFVTSQLVYSSNIVYTGVNYTYKTTYQRTTTSSAIQQINQISLCNITTTYEPMIQLNSNILFTRQNRTYAVPEGAVIRLQDGICTTFTQDDVNRRSIYIRNTNQPVSLQTTFTQVPYIFTPIFVPQANVLVSPVLHVYDFNITTPTGSALSVLDPSTKGLPFIATIIHVLDAYNVYVKNDTGNIIQISDLNRVYLSILTYSPTAELRVVYATPGYQSVTLPITIRLNVKRSQHTQMQHVNNGISTMNNALTPYVVNGSIGDTFTMDVQQSFNVSLSSTLFTMQDILNDTVRVSIPNITQNGVLSFKNVVSNMSYTVTCVPFTYHQYLDPALQTTRSKVLLQTIGQQSHQSLFDGTLWQHYQTKVQRFGSVYNVNDTLIRVLSVLSNGILWNKTQPNTVVTEFTFQDIFASNIYYIPYNVHANSNLDVYVTLQYNGVTTTSRPYQIEIKNYVSTFPSKAYCSTFIQREPLVTSNIYISSGLRSDGLVWSPGVVTLPQQTSNIAPSNVTFTLNTSFASTWTFEQYADSKPISWLPSTPSIIQTTMGATEAHFLKFLLSYIEYDERYIQDIHFHVTPMYDVIIQHVTTGELSIGHFTLRDVLEDRVIMLNYMGALGEFDVHISTTPYDVVSSVSRRVNIRMIQPPSITFCKDIHVYSDNSNIFKTTQQQLYPHIRIDTTSGGYMYMSTLPQNTVTTYNSNVVSGIIPVQNYSSGFATFTVDTLLSGSSSFPYSNHTLEIIPAVGNNPYTNRVWGCNLYRNTTIIPHTLEIIVNRYVSLNTVDTQKQNVQELIYDFNQTLPEYQNALSGNKSFTFSIDVRPYSYILDDVWTDKVAYFQSKFPITYTIELLFIDHANQTLIAYELNQQNVRVRKGTDAWQVFQYPNNSPLLFTTWNTIVINLQDIQYPLQNASDSVQYAISCYVKYDKLRSKQENEQFNILRFSNIAGIDSALISKVILRVNNSPDPISVTSNNVPTGNMSMYYQLQDHQSFVLLRNVEMYVTTYDTTSSTENVVQNVHNVILGKDVTVRGTNNICIGNQFNTSGQKSIIVGNNIGQTQEQGQSIADIYQSIVIGNDSFNNALINDIICIGNNNFNNLYDQPVAQISEFLSRKPVIVGNDIENTEFNINICNTVLRSDLYDSKIFIGSQQQHVYVGHTTPSANLNRYVFNVSGDMTVSGLIDSSALCSQYKLATGFNIQDVLYKIVSVDSTSDDSICILYVSSPKNIIGVCVGSEGDNVLVQYKGIVDIDWKDTATFEIGDYVTSSNGYAIKQHNSDLRNTTVAKIISPALQIDTERNQSRIRCMLV